MTVQPIDPGSRQTITLPGIDDDTNALLAQLLRVLADRHERNQLRADYYDAHRMIRQLSPVVPPQYYRLGLVLGWTAKAVDGLARRCNLDGFAWPDGDLDSLGGSTIWDQNHLGSEVNSAIIASLIHGPAFLVNTEGDAGEPTSLIHVKNALDATGTWNPRKRGLDNLLSILARDPEGNPTQLALYLDGRTILATASTGLGGRTWDVEITDHEWGVPAEPLVYKPRVGRAFGSSRISRPVMALQDAAVRSLVRLEGHMDVYSYPELWMLGADESIFRNRDRWEVMLGRLKGIPDDEDATTPRADVKQFPAADPQPHLAALNAVAKMFARETSLPDTALAITDLVNPTSADAYDASQYELIAEAEGATDDWTPALRRAMVRALAIANDVAIADVPDSWLSIDCKWRDPRFQSRAALADAGLKQLTAVPWLADSDVGLELLGLDEGQIKRALAFKRQQAGSSLVDKLLAARPATSPSTTPTTSPTGASDAGPAAP